MGLVLGMFMLEPLVMFVNDTFRIVTSSLQANTMTGVFSTIAFIALYVMLILMIVDKSFSLIHVIPDRVLTWIGGPGALTGEEREFEGKGKTGIVASGQAVSTIMLGKGIGGRMTTMGSSQPGLVPKANKGPGQS